jgi:2-polyprenyl-3-methyl-5-hydroxy-6-metoxy-1,4-benzoquinol methylase
VDGTQPGAGDAVHPAYDNARPEVAALVPDHALSVLDIGCATGRLGASLKQRVPRRRVVGIERDPMLADIAATRLDHVLIGDLEELAAKGEHADGPFDCIVAADVLEHLRDPWTVVRWAAEALVPEGIMVISVPNIRHLQTLWSVGVRAHWPYEGMGLFDRTHLRWFARRNLPELFAGTDLRIVEVGRVQLVSTDPTNRWNRVAPYLRDLGTLQFLVTATKVRR